MDADDIGRPIGTHQGRRQRLAPGLGTGLGLALASLALLIGLTRFDSGSATAARQDDTAAQATATRDAELAELAQLQDRVAELEAQRATQCVEPSPTVAPTPAPPQAAGQPVTYVGDWTVVVVSATSRPTVKSATAKGIFVELVLQVTNDAGAARTFPFPDVVLTDAQGRSFGVDPAATTLLDVDWSVPITPYLPTEQRLVFDVAADAGESFVFESKSDPSFRVTVTLTQRG